MSEEKNNIDQLFRDAAQSEQAPQYDAAYWADMNAMLNKREAKKRAFLLWAFGGSAAFAVLLLSLFTLNMDNSLAEKRYVKEEMNLQIEEAELINNEKSTIQENESKTVSTNVKEQITLNKVQIDNSSTSQNTSISTKQSDNQLRKQNNKIANQENRETNSIDKEKSSNINQKEVKANDNASYIFKDNKSNTSDNRSEKNLSDENQENFLNEIEKNEVNTISEETKEIETTLPYTSANQIAQKDAGSIIRSTIEVKAKPQFMLYTKLSGGLMENYKTSRPYESGLVDLSLNVEVNLNNVLLRSGIGAQWTSNADLIVSQRAKVYGFDVVNHQNDLSYQSLFDIYIPLEIGYQFNNTSFGVGAQANYLLTTSMDLNHYENNFLVDTEKYYGNSSGLNSFSTQGYVWLEHKFTPIISCGLKAGTNISGRIKDGAFFNQSATTNPIYGQLSLRFNLIR